MAPVMILITVSIITEGITEWLKMSFKLDDNANVIYIITAALGVAVALLTGADIFAALGISTRVPFVGQILTGVLCSRGSNYVYDVMRKLSPDQAAQLPAEEQTAPHGYDEQGRG